MTTKGLFLILLAVWACPFPAGAEDGRGEALRKKLELFAPPTGETKAELDRLVKLLESKKFTERAAALKALTERPLLPESVLGLAETHPDLEVRYQLKKLRDDPKRASYAADMLAETLKELEGAKVEGLAEAVLGALPAAKEASVLPLAGRAMNETATEDDREKLLAAMKREDFSDEMRRALIPALGKIGGEGVDEALVGALEGGDTRLKAAAALALAKRGRREALGAFGDLLESDDLMVRWHAVAALRDVTGQHFGYGPGGNPEKRAAAVAKWRKWIDGIGPDVKLKGLGELPAGVDLLADGLGGWTSYDRGGRKGKPEEQGWELGGGLLKIGGEKGSGTDLRTTAVFKDYVLRLEWQNIEGSFGDSGIGICCSPEVAASANYLEIQVLPGRTGDLYRIGGFSAKVEGGKLGFSRTKLKESNEKPAGDWNQMEVRLNQGKMEVRINGELQNSAEGLPKEPGRIVLRNEGHPVWFRNMVVLPLE